MRTAAAALMTIAVSAAGVAVVVRPHLRGTTNRNVRGSAESRRRRKQWLLDTFGDGTTAACFVETCTTVLSFTTITVDRIHLGMDGGSYRRGNIRPACGFHNSSEGSKAMWARRRGEA
jgi:hypothetical protein